MNPKITIDTYWESEPGQRTETNESSDQMITYHCEGCGVEVNNFANQAVPKSGFCLTCELINDSHRHDLKEFWAIYNQLYRVDTT